MQPETAGEAMVWRPGPWRRIVDYFLPQSPPDESWYAMHDDVPKGGDMIVQQTEVRFGWRGLLRLLCLRGIEIETRAITREPVNVIGVTRAHTRIW